MDLLSPVRAQDKRKREISKRVRRQFEWGLRSSSEGGCQQKQISKTTQTPQWTLCFAPFNNRFSYYILPGIPGNTNINIFITPPDPALCISECRGKYWFLFLFLLKNLIIDQSEPPPHCPRGSHWPNSQSPVRLTSFVQFEVITYETGSCNPL